MKLRSSRHAARRVLGDLLVVVAVAAFHVERVAAPLVLLGLGLEHHPAVGRMREVGPGRVLNPQHRNQPIAVEILRRILIHPAVAIVVDWAGVPGAFPEWPLKERFRRVRRRSGNHVECVPLERFPDRLLRPGLFDQPPRQPHRQLAADQMRRVHAPHDQDRRFFVPLAGADRQQPHVASPMRSRKRLQLGKGALGDRLKLLAMSVVVQMALEGRLAGEAGAQQGKCEQGGCRCQQDWPHGKESHVHRPAAGPPITEGIECGAKGITLP